MIGAYMFELQIIEVILPIDMGSHTTDPSDSVLLSQVEMYCESLSTARDGNKRIKKIYHPRSPGFAIVSSFSANKKWEPITIALRYVTEDVLAQSDSTIPDQNFNDLGNNIVSASHQRKMVSDSLVYC